eukprot:CAMPEP_0168594432 /NCGR_PEP_ID=MMETSP0420-20121227/8896_1 /TAXON_ID=498008 /ORGANISM="Pessonella sp." /LENGTH=202 /DNA_ID=CAMNT_0008630753 /DNA_START=397 /DNA_END=1002 /DNA_ORIENTATION=+
MALEELTLEQWLNVTETRHHSTIGYITHNYYVKNLLPKHPHNGSRGRDYDVTEWHFEAAKAILASFDLVVILEWDETPEQNAVLDKLFQLDTKYPYYNKNKHVVQQNLAEVAPHTLARLQRVNQYDLQLYEYAKRLALQQQRYIASDAYSALVGTAVPPLVPPTPLPPPPTPHTRTFPPRRSFAPTPRASLPPSSSSSSSSS